MFWPKDNERNSDRAIHSWCSRKGRRGEEESKGDTVRSIISNYVQKYYKVFKGGGPAAVILLIYQHQAIVASKKLKKNYVTIKSRIDAKKV